MPPAVHRLRERLPPTVVIESPGDTEGWTPGPACPTLMEIQDTPDSTASGSEAGGRCGKGHAGQGRGKFLTRERLAKQQLELVSLTTGAPRT